MNQIPVVIMEEHCEAFAIWNEAVIKGVLPPFGSTLLHVDHHADFVEGYYEIDLSEGLDIEKIKYLDEEVLGIANFIIPAIWQGIFNKHIFIKNTLPEINYKLREKTITLTGANRLKLTDVPMGMRKKLIEETDKHRIFHYGEGGLGQLEHIGNCLLDIDLDYFCTDDSLSTGIERSIEITKDAYEDYLNNKYHPLKILPIRVVKIIERNGKYYFIYDENIEKKPWTDERAILKRIDKFIAWINENNIEPRMIDICRSRYSGYTPIDKWKFIERNLLEALEKYYGEANIAVYEDKSKWL